MMLNEIDELKEPAMERNSSNLLSVQFQIYACQKMIGCRFSRSN